MKSPSRKIWLLNIPSTAYNFPHFQISAKNMAASNGTWHEVVIFHFLHGWQIVAHTIMKLKNTRVKPYTCMAKVTLL